MASAVVLPRERAAARAGSSALFVSLSAVHAALLLLVPSVPLIGIGLWWNANTVAHNFIHRPFFRGRRMNEACSLWLTLVLGVPQSLWRVRHLRHHAEGTYDRSRTTVRIQAPPVLLAVESAALAGLWAVMLVVAPAFFAFVYLPGLLLGLALCQLQGFYEHAHGTTSHYGRLYNWLFFNDGYHVEHHLRPGAPWTELARTRAADARASRWPPVLRWLDAVSLDGLERLVVRHPVLQRFVVRVHARAARRVLAGAGAGAIERVVIVGGGLFPRSALVLRDVLPGARLTIVDSSAENLDVARTFLPRDVEFRHAAWSPDDPIDADLVVIPLAFVGDRSRVLSSPPARAVLVHCWIWSPVRGVVISWLLLKKLVLITSAAPR